MAEIKFELPNELKTELKSYAAANSMSVAACIRQAIQNEISGKNGKRKYPDQNNNTDEERTRRVYVYFSEAEYQEIVTRAEGHSLSSYIRHAALSATVPIKIEIETEDVQMLITQIIPYVRRFTNYLEGARYRSTITEADYKRLLDIATDISGQLAEYIHLTKKNQTAIRNAGIRHIKKQINNYMKEET